MTRQIVLAVVGGLVLLVALSSVFIVDERQKALVLQFGKVAAVHEKPGLYFKVPLIQNVVKYDDRILGLDTQSLEVTPLDDRRLVVDAFARWRIDDVVQFRKAVGAGGVPLAENRLSKILVAATRQVLGQVPSNTILSAEREKLMARIRDIARDEAKALGVEMIDVRLKRTDLPTQNLEATFARMRAEREREAADERARGREAAQKVRAQADRTRVEIVSKAQKEAEIIRGEADARRNAIFAEAYGRDPEFFAFYRSLRAYEQALAEGNTSLVLSPNSEFFAFFRSETGALAAPAAAAVPGPGEATAAGQ
ncbi:MAG: protease modulator HflC [Alphaproteobacteria bacterium]|nr:MAG: protease modulator HflC [Alphaproteobacteria bacterium]